MKTQHTRTAASRRVRLASLFALVACVSALGPTIAEGFDGPEFLDRGRGADIQRGDDGREPSERAYFPRSRYTWPYAGGPAYGRPASGGREAGWLIHPVGSFRLDAGPLPLPLELTPTSRSRSSTARRRTTTATAMGSPTARATATATGSETSW